MSSASVFPPPPQTRLVTIIAQVDHGKTTLADNLIEANGIISERLAGSLRYLDSLEEEQRRGITIRTSAIGLRHIHQATVKSDPTKMTIHLLDSPGHTDFAPEVSSALLSCDAALLVIDVVEGMCARTHQVLREAYVHELVPILVLNKVDRLCTDLCLTPTEAYVRLRNLLESVNAATAAMLVSTTAEAQHGQDDWASNDIAIRNTAAKQFQEANDQLEERWRFEPSKGNVVFASAYHGWGFTVPSLSKALFRSKSIAVKPVVLRQYLFGDFKYKEEKVLKWKQNDAALPLFAEYALKPIWRMYEGVATAMTAIGVGSELFADGRTGLVRNDQANTSNAGRSSSVETKLTGNTPGMDHVLDAMQVGSTATSNSLPTTSIELQQILTKTGSFTEASALRSLLRRYRPVSDSVLDAVCEHGPSPAVAAREVRTRALALRGPESDATNGFRKLKAAVLKCDPSGPLVAHIGKFVSTDPSYIRDQDISVDPDKKTHLILGVARVLSGTLQTNDSYYWMGPKHAFGAPVTKKMIRLYLLMGSSFVRVDEVPAGHLCAVYGLEELQLKTVTLCDIPDGMPLKGFDRGIRPLVKVNVEPVNSSDTDALERGLIKLSLADAAVEVTATAKGERLLACLGEIHLEQSILDLQKIYCGKEVELRISDPIVELGETTDWCETETSDYSAFCTDRSSAPLRQTAIPPYCDEEGIRFAYRGRTRAIVSGRVAGIGLRVVPLAESIYQSLKEKKIVEGSEDEIKRLGLALGVGEKLQSVERIFGVLLDSLCSLDTGGNGILENRGLENGSCIRCIVGDEVYVPPKDEGMESDTPTGGKDEYEDILYRIQHGGILGPVDQAGTVATEADAAALDMWKTKMRGSAVAGFQMAMRSGPLCEEPVRGVLVVLESFEVALQVQDGTFACSKPLSGGMVVAALRQGIRCALLSRPARIMESHLKLTLHSSLAGLGSLYGVLAKRRGKVIEDSMVDGTDLLLITATLPQAESFRLTPELLAKTSGEVTVPELTFLKWERLDEDPFWIPMSLEEREDFGEIIVNGDLSTGVDSTALNYIRKVRDRKGLLMDSGRTVVAAEKQRTLKR